MPKVNFHVPFLNPHGEIVKEPKRNFDRMKRNSKGEFEAEIVTDEDGYAIMEKTMLDNVVIDILMGHYEGDYAIPGVERLKRDELAKKVKMASLVADASEAADYNNDELEMIRGLTNKSRPTAVLGELNRAINALSFN